MNRKMVVVVSVMFCGVIVAERSFSETEKADNWAKEWEHRGDCEQDGPQFTTEWRNEYI